MVGKKSKGETSETVVTSIRVTPAELEKLKAGAAADRRSVSSFLVIAGLERAERLGVRVKGKA